MSLFITCMLLSHHSDREWACWRNTQGSKSRTALSLVQTHHTGHWQTRAWWLQGKIPRYRLGNSHHELLYAVWVSCFRASLVYKVRGFCHRVYWRCQWAKGNPELLGHTPGQGSTKEFASKEHPGIQSPLGRQRYGTRFWSSMACCGFNRALYTTVQLQHSDTLAFVHNCRHRTQPTRAPALFEQALLRLWAAYPRHDRGGHQTPGAAGGPGSCVPRGAASCSFLQSKVRTVQRQSGYPYGKIVTTDSNDQPLWGGSTTSLTELCVSCLFADHSRPLKSLYQTTGPCH